jgi:NAD(P)-dependent dehydrogenase (short-subunit alcohol dehydrogenase family)
MIRYEGLQGRAVLITGAAGGLGRALAQGFAEQGSRLVLVDVDGDGLVQLRRELEAIATVTTVQADLSEASACDMVVERSVAAYGELHVLVNNAAILARTPLETLQPPDFERVIGVNLRAPLFLARAAVAPMRAAGGGRIINVASMAARTGGTGDLHLYAASKGGLVTLTRSLAGALASDGILVNAILPSNIDTPMLRSFPPERLARLVDAIPLRRLADPREVAQLVLWLASDAASYVTGAAWEINGGWLMGA